MKMVKLDEVVRRCQTREDRYDTDLEFYVGGEHFESGQVELAGRGRIDGSTIGPMFYYGFKPGDFLLVSRNPHLKKAARVDFPGICSEKTFVLETKDPEVLLPDFLPWVLQNDRFWDYAQANRHGSTNFFINWSTLAEYEFPLPDVDKQREISGILWSAQHVRRCYRRQMAVCDDLVKSQFIEMFGTLGPGSSKYKKVRLDSIAQTRLGKMLDKKQQTGEHPARYLANHNVQWFRFDLDELEMMDFTDDDREEFALHDGDLMMCEGGEVGRCAIWHNQLEECYFQKAIHRIRCNTDVVLPEYLAWHFKIAADEGLLVKHTNASTIAHLSGVKLKALQIVLPPIDGQREFVRFSKQVDKSKFALQKALDDLDAMTKKLMSEELGLGNV